MSPPKLPRSSSIGIITMFVIRAHEAFEVKIEHLPVAANTFLVQLRYIVGLEVESGKHFRDGGGGGSEGPARTLLVNFRGFLPIVRDEVAEVEDGEAVDRREHGQLGPRL